MTEKKKVCRECEGEEGFPSDKHLETCTGFSKHDILEDIDLYDPCSTYKSKICQCFYWLKIWEKIE